MRQLEVRGLGTRFLRASLLTGLAVSALPGIFFIFAYLDFVSPQWDPANDSGVVQGYWFLGISSALAVIFALVAFPTAAFLLRNKFSRWRFLGTLFVFLAVLSTGASLVTASSLDDLRLTYAFGPLFLVSASILTLPFAWLWVILARNDA
jgi:hypothetical protein